MESRVGSFIAVLALDAGRLEEYRADPDAAMAAAGLSEEERSLLRAGTWQHICEYLAPEDPVTRPMTMSQGTDPPGGGG